MFGKYQLIINYKKTETMILNYLDTDLSTILTEHIKNANENESHLQRKNCNIRPQETPNLTDHNKWCMKMKMNIIVIYDTKYISTKAA